MFDREYPATYGHTHRWRITTCCHKRTRWSWLGSANESHPQRHGFKLDYSAPKNELGKSGFPQKLKSCKSHDLLTLFSSKWFTKKTFPNRNHGIWVPRRNSPPNMAYSFSTRSPQTMHARGSAMSFLQLSSNISLYMSANISSNLSSNNSPNIFGSNRQCFAMPPKFQQKQMTKHANRIAYKGIYRRFRKEHSQIINQNTASAFPLLDWREPRSTLCSGNQRVPDPKSQLPDKILLPNESVSQKISSPKPKRKRSETALLIRKANRKAKRAAHRLSYRKLRKQHAEVATQHVAYPVAQVCPSVSTSMLNSDPNPFWLDTPEAPPSKGLPVLQLASLNLDGGINHVSGRQTIVHLMKTLKIDVLWLQETRVNRNCLEQHDNYVFLLLVFHHAWTKKPRRTSKKRTTGPCSYKELSEIELYNLDAEKLGVGLVMHKLYTHGAGVL